jgi:hypothetical protein
MNRVDQDGEVSSLPRFDQGRAFATLFHNTEFIAFDCFQPAGNDATDRIIAAAIIAEAYNQDLLGYSHAISQADLSSPCVEAQIEGAFSNRFEVTGFTPFQF